MLLIRKIPKLFFPLTTMELAPGARLKDNYINMAFLKVELIRVKCYFNPFVQDRFPRKK